MMDDAAPAAISSAEFRALLLSTGLNQREFAAVLGKRTTTVNRWCTGGLTPPRYAVAYLELYLERRPPPDRIPVVRERP